MGKNQKKVRRAVQDTGLSGRSVRTADGGGGLSGPPAIANGGESLAECVCGWVDREPTECAGAGTREENEKLKAKVGELTMQVDIQKKRKSGNDGSKASIRP